LFLSGPETEALVGAGMVAIFFPLSSLGPGVCFPAPLVVLVPFFFTSFTHVSIRDDFSEPTRTCHVSVSSSIFSADRAARACAGIAS
jgi:hypothetical protein